MAKSKDTPTITSHTDFRCPAKAHDTIHSIGLKRSHFDMKIETTFVVASCLLPTLPTEKNAEIPSGFGFWDSKIPASHNDLPTGIYHTVHRRKWFLLNEKKKGDSIHVCTTRRLNSALPGTCTSTRVPVSIYLSISRLV